MSEDNLWLREALSTSHAKLAELSETHRQLPDTFTMFDELPGEA